MLYFLMTKLRSSSHRSRGGPTQSRGQSETRQGERQGCGVSGAES